jgi:hypothetical protein
MCMFCAAVPVTAVVGVNLNTRQKAAQRTAKEKGIEAPVEKPIAKMTLGAIILLTIASIIYHTVIMPI